MNGASSGRSAGLDVLMQVPLQVTAQLGACRLTVSELLKIGNGSVLELDRAADAPIDVLVSEMVVARGQIVAVGQHFGVRITELVGHAQ